MATCSDVPLLSKYLQYSISSKMPFVPDCPENRIPRSDSKDPGTTCRGITRSGKPCRVSIQASRQNSPSQEYDDEHFAAAALFCHYHQDQAKNFIEDPIRILGPEEQKPNMDKLRDWLSELNVQDSLSPPERHYRRRSTGETRISFTVSCEMTAEPDYDNALSTMVEGEDTSGHDRCITRVSATVITSASSTPTRPASQRHAYNTDKQDRPLRDTAPLVTTARPLLSRDFSSRTQALLSLFPETLSPNITSALLAELDLPISTSDQEDGWIYMYWLTPAASVAPSTSLASSLLAPSPTRMSGHARRTSDVIRDYSSSASPTKNDSLRGNKTTMLLKIGRTSNVQRRMNEWRDKCRVNVSVIRTYPCDPSPITTSSRSPSRSPSPFSSPSRSPSPSPPRAIPHKVPHPKRVERLIHIELADQRVDRVCEGCSTKHREWFEIKGTREGLRAVDAVIKRWVGWALDKYS